MKKIVAALGLLAGMAVAQSEVQIDVTLRDFPLGHPDFESWDFNSGNGGECAEGSGDRTTSLATPENAVCFDGDTYLPCSEGGEPLYYGQDDCNDAIAKRGYTNGPDATIKGNACWKNRVYVTRGMVADELSYSDCSAEELTDVRTKALCARPVKAQDLCHNGNFDQWFSKNGFEGKKINDVLVFAKEPTTSYYRIQYDFNTRTDWNGFGEDNGYFPLDAYVRAEDPNTFGLQSLNVWCPDAGAVSYDLNQNCKTWQANGGPLDENAAVKTAQDRGIMNKLHNYGFTVAGVVPFKYKPGLGEVFQFIGDDDMWIFIDGKLVADLGGTHSAAPATIRLDEVAANHSASGADWSEGSTHVINFYYAERQTDGSNLMMRLTVSGILPPMFGAPVINKAETYGSGSDAYTLLYVSNKLNLDVINNNYLNNTDKFAILVDKINGDTLGYKLTSIAYKSNQGAAGQVYEIKGGVCLDAGCTTLGPLTTGDSLAFNFRSVDGELVHPLYLGDDDAQIVNERGNAVVQPRWGRNSTTLPPIVFDPTINDATVKKPNFDVESMFTPGSTTVSVSPANSDRLNYATSDAGKTGTVTINGFGSASNATLPPSKTGEMILTAYPSSTDPNWKSNLAADFGLPSEATINGIYGVADGSTGTFLKNGFPGESNLDGSMKVSPTRCVTDKNDNVNCLNFSLDAKQPFKLNVTVFDHLGHFITQYKESVSEQEFRYATQATAIGGTDVAASDACKEVNGTSVKYGDPNALTNNGYLKVNVNIYPFSQTGRRIGNGVYILKIDRIDEAFNGCMNASGVGDMGENKFVRYHAESKLGWMRTK